MKLSKTFIAVLVGGLIVIAFVAVYMARSQGLSQQNEAKASLAKVSASLPKATSDRQAAQNQVNLATDKLTQLQGQLSDAQTRLKAGLKVLPSSVDSMKYDDKLFTIANGWNLKITDLSVASPTSVVASGLTYSVSSYSVHVVGQDPATVSPPLQTADDYTNYINNTMNDILHFVNAIATDTSGDFSNATVRVMSITSPQPPTQADIDAGATLTDRPSASIEIAIYAYKGE